MRCGGEKPTGEALVNSARGETNDLVVGSGVRAFAHVCGDTQGAVVEMRGGTYFLRGGEEGRTVGSLVSPRPEVFLWLGLEVGEFVPSSTANLRRWR